VDELEPESLLALPSLESFELLLDSFAVPLSEDELEEPLADFVDDLESVIYQPLPLKTMPTG
jgi:hypothetical protein